MYKDISKLKNIHKGEDIWVVLGGSSMDYIDSDFFKNTVIFYLRHTSL